MPVLNDLTLLLLSSSTCKGESFTFGQDVAVLSGCSWQCHPQGHLSTGTKALHLDFTRTSQLKLDGLQKLVPKPTPRESRTEQKNHISTKHKQVVQINISPALGYSKHKQQVLLDKTKKYFLDLPQNDEVRKLPGKAQLTFQVLTVKWKQSKTSHS